MAFPPPLSASRRSQAACRGADTALWFPESSDHETADQAKTICAGCPVIDSCRVEAIANAAEVGIWGGLTESQRRRERVGQAA
jgi:WhiB family redox-sensing transcriptional regulator